MIFKSGSTWEQRERRVGDDRWDLIGIAATLDECMEMS